MRLLSTSEDRQVYGYDDNFHFYASSSLDWRCSQDLEKLIKEMRGLSKVYSSRNITNPHFWIFYIPAPIETPYEIVNYQPQYEGRIFLGEYQ